jgi:hypothetical protein
LTAQTRAVTTNTKFGVQYAYQNDDKEILCEMIKAIQAITECSLKDIVTFIINSEGDYSAYNKHYSRIKGWLNVYDNGGFKYVLDPIAKVVINQPEVAEQAVDQVVLTNLKESVKAICKAAIKNNMSGGDLCNMFERSFMEVVEEIKVKAFDLKLKAFLRENNIEKDVAFQILETY